MEQLNANLFELQLDQPALGFLNESARWAKFLSILGFIFCGLILLMGVFFGSILTSLMAGTDNSSATSETIGGVFTSVICILTGLIFFFPSLYLFNFSSKMKKAYQSNDQVILTGSLKNLKSFFKFYGIFTVVVLSLYFLALIAAIIGAVLGHKL